MGKQRNSSTTIRKRMTSSTFIMTMQLVILSFVVLIVLGFRILSMPTRLSEDVPKGGHDHDLTSIVRDTSVDNSTGGRGKPWVEVISWEPRAFVYHNFLSKEECEHIIELAKPYMIRSTVVDDDSETGASTLSSVRTSTGMFLSRGADQVIRDIEKRIADFTFIPVENGEGLQVLHYGVGEKYEPHSDYFLDKFNIQQAGQRVATLLMYLVINQIATSIVISIKLDTKGACSGYVRSSNVYQLWIRQEIKRIVTKYLQLDAQLKDTGRIGSDVEEGGETIFPVAQLSNNSAAVPVRWPNLSNFDCRRRKIGGLRVKPKMGNALLFWNLKPDATQDPRTLHGGCPVIKGDKWSATKWMHLKQL